MKKTETLTWENIYRHWRLWGNRMSEYLQEPFFIEKIPIDYRQRGRFYGYDWLSRKAYEKRKHLIETDVTSFLFFTQPTNKGTIHTLQMLLEAKDDEERAAIWLYAFTKEIMDTADISVRRFAHQINDICWDFLNERFYMWHHAMKRLVPENYINYSLLADVEYASADAIIDLARMNAVLVAYEYIPILYSSLEPGETAPDISVRKAK